MKYYVQVIARNYLKKLPLQRSTVRVHPSYLQGLTEDEFIGGYNALIGFLREIYTDIINNPSNFDVPLIEIPPGEHENSNCTKSHYGSKSRYGVVSIPQLLLAIGNVGALAADMTLCINGGEFEKKTKQLHIPNTAALLQIFADYGFEITGVSEKISKIDEISIGYPDCRALTAALKSIAEAQSKIGEVWYKGMEYFYMMAPQLVESETPKIKFDIEDIFHFLNDESLEIAKALHNCAVSHAKCKVSKDFSGGNPHNIRTCSYTGKKTKKIIMSFKTRDGNISVKMNLEGINGYMGEIMQMPGHIKENICKNGWQCHRCRPKCIGGFSFEMSGSSYNTCRDSAFWFYYLSVADLPHIKKMLELEIRREM